MEKADRNIIKEMKFMKKGLLFIFVLGMVFVGGTAFANQSSGQGLMRRLDVYASSVNTGEVSYVETNTSASFGQTAVAAPVEQTTKMGFMGGLNYSNLYVSDVTTENAKLGYHAGVFIKIPFSSFISFQPELLYSTKGAEITYTGTANGTASIALNYIDLPLMFLFNLSEALSLQIGPYASYLTSVKVDNKSGSSNFSSEISTSNFALWDYGIIGGIQLGNENFYVYLKYNYGLVNIGIPQQFFGTTYNFPNGKNSVAQFGASISI